MSKKKIYISVFVILLAGLVFIAAQIVTHARNPAISRIKETAKQAQVLIKQRARDGQNVSGVLAQMKAVRALIDGRNFAEAESMLNDVIASLESGDVIQPEDGAALREPTTGEFGKPRKVVIRGFDGGTMEPFITRDDRYLMFNSARDAFGAGNEPPSLHLARKVDDTTFEYIGKLEGANSEAFDGAATVDRNNVLYFSSTRQYEKTLSLIHSGKFEDGKVSGVGLVSGNVSKKKGGWLNMDAEISADGKTLYFVDTTWDTRNNVPKTSDLQIAKRTGDSFKRVKNSEEILANVTSDELEYAAALSDDELELFFTRARFNMVNGKLAGINSRIMMANRSSANEPFSAPKRIADISGFVEGPTISTDGKRLYYHKKEDGKYRLYMVSRQ